MYKPRPTHQLELSSQNQVGAQVPCSRDFLPRKKYQKYQKHIAGLQLKLEMERVDINKTYCCGLALKLMQFNSCGLSNTNISYCVITNLFFFGITLSKKTETWPSPHRIELLKDTYMMCMSKGKLLHHIIEEHNFEAGKVIKWKCMPNILNVSNFFFFFI